MPSIKSKGGFYAVNKGREIGVFYTWVECEEQVKGYTGARFKKFGTMAEAQCFAYQTTEVPLPMVSSSLPVRSKPTRMENIEAALASMPSRTQPLPSSVPSSTPPVRPSSQKRFEQIYLALTTSPSTSDFNSNTTPSRCTASIISVPPSLSKSEMSSSSSRSIISLSTTSSPPTSPLPRHNDIWSTPTTPESSPLKTPLPQPQYSDDGPLSQFFSQFPSFTPSLDKSTPTEEFDRMCKSTKLDGDLKKKRRIGRQFQDALSQEFNDIYGTDVDCLQSWQAICVRIGIIPIPDTLEECRELVTNIHVNLVDLTTPEGEIQIFRSSKELSEYTRSTNKIFSRSSMFAGDLLQHLLRHIFNPKLDADKDRRGEEIMKNYARKPKGRKFCEDGRKRRRFAPY